MDIGKGIVVMFVTQAPKQDIGDLLEVPLVEQEGVKSAYLLSGYTECDFDTLEKYVPHIDEVMPLFEADKPIYTARIGVEYNKRDTILTLTDTGEGGLFHFYANTAQKPSVFPPVKVGSCVFYQPRGMNTINLVYEKAELFQNYYDCEFYDEESKATFGTICRENLMSADFLEETTPYAPSYMANIVENYPNVLGSYCNIFPTKYNKKQGYIKVAVHGKPPHGGVFKLTAGENPTQFLEKLRDNIAPLLMVSEGNRVRVLY